MSTPVCQRWEPSSSSSSGDSDGGPVHVCLSGEPVVLFLTQVEALLLERRTLWRGPVPDRLWHCFDWWSFHVHSCLLDLTTCQCTTGPALGEKFCGNEGQKQKPKSTVSSLSLPHSHAPPQAPQLRSTPAPLLPCDFYPDRLEPKLKLIHARLLPTEPLSFHSTSFVPLL